MRLVILFIVVIFCNSIMEAQTLTPYEVSKDENNSSVILKGLINEAILKQETSFTWLANSIQGYTPNATAVATLKAKASNLQFLVFGGTWCEDTQQLLPKFFAIAKAAAISDNQITLLGVDRKKQSIGNLSAAFGVTNVPTFIVLKNGTEIGRIVEYGTMGGKIDEEFAQIVAK
jgi:thiol-disulfide isomerase/thioredoxin